jgi:hypothetical protein
MGGLSVGSGSFENAGPYRKLGENPRSTLVLVEKVDLRSLKMMKAAVNVVIWIRAPTMANTVGSAG